MRLLTRKEIRKIKTKQQQREMAEAEALTSLIADLKQERAGLIDEIAKLKELKNKHG
jgi:hypothetical protein